MNKLKTIVLSLMMAIILCSCGQPKEDMVPLDWNNMYIEVNDTKVTFPCEYSEFKETTNLAFEDEELVLPAKTYDTLLLGGNVGASLYIVNDTNEDKSIKDCDVYGMIIINTTLEEKGYKIEFPGYCVVGEKTSIRKITKNLGKPTIISEDKDIVSYLESGNPKIMQITIEKNKIKHLNFNYTPEGINMFHIRN